MVDERVQNEGGIGCDQHFIQLNCLMNLVIKLLFEMCHSLLEHFFSWYVFLNLFTQLSCPLGYAAFISSKVGMTAHKPLHKFPG